MASKQKDSAAPAPDRPPAEQVARANYKREFGTSKPDATLPPADEQHEPDTEPALAPAVGDETTKEN